MMEVIAFWLAFHRAASQNRAWLARQERSREKARALGLLVP